MMENAGHWGDMRLAGPEYSAYLMRQQGEELAENLAEIDENTMTEVRKTAKILNEIIAAKRETQ